MPVVTRLAWFVAWPFPAPGEQRPREHFYSFPLPPSRLPNEGQTTPCPAGCAPLAALRCRCVGGQGAQRKWCAPTSVARTLTYVRSPNSLSRIILGAILSNSLPLTFGVSVRCLCHNLCVMERSIGVCLLPPVSHALYFLLISLRVLRVRGSAHL